MDNSASSLDKTLLKHNLKFIVIAETRVYSETMIKQYIRYTNQNFNNHIKLLHNPIFNTI